MWVLGAFALGLILFLLVWKNSGNSDFYRAGPVAPTAAGPDYAPLPAPTPAGSSDSASGMGEAPTPQVDDEGRPRLVETTPPPAPAAPPPPPRPAAPTASTPAQVISSPAPRYPAMALRRGESGKVLVSVEVGPDGVPATVEVAKSSGSRDLDRAAMEAVRRWRFSPAMDGERPVSSRVQVPISFER
ncbi:energy transducer TonB [Lysobacter fragariae]